MKKNNYLIFGFSYCIVELSELIKKNGTMQSISSSEKSDANIFQLFKRKYPIQNKKSINDYSDINIDVFHEMYSRHWYPRSYSKLETREQIDYYINYFDQYLSKNKINIIVFQNIPHEGPDYILYCMARKLSLKAVVFFQSLFPGYSFCSSSIENIFLKKGIEDESDKMNNSVVKGVFEKSGNWFYMENVKVNKSLFIATFNNTLKYFRRKIYLYPQIIKDIFRFSKSYNKIYKNMNFDSVSGDYIYFPLHLQPELTTSALSAKYFNQLEALKRLRTIIPSEIKIVVKENPKQSPFKRDEVFFSEIQKIKNLYFSLPYNNSIELIKQSLGVATITGTAGWEALTLGKPSIIFGNSWYQDFPGVFSNENFNWDEFYNYVPLNKNNLTLDVHEKLSLRTYNVVCDTAYSKLVPNFSFSQNIKKIHDIILKVQPFSE